MASSSRTPIDNDPGRPMSPEYFSDCRARVDEFVDRHFTWPGTLRLHGAAMSWDILRAPTNVLLSPLFVLTRVLTALCRRLGLRKLANWLAGRRILLSTAVARRVEACIVTDLLDLPLPEGAAARDPEALSHAVLSAPQFHDLMRRQGSAAEADVIGRSVANAIREYAGTRSAVAEMTTTLIALAVGVVAFQAVTPGLLSMAPDLADAVSRTTAIANFPLGRTIGTVWYGAFPPGASPLLISAVVAGLVMVGSVFAAFAGVLADPVQSRLGIHRRRLLRLIDAIEAEVTGPGHKPFTAREHYYARVLDLWDAGVSVLRIFRN